MTTRNTQLAFVSVLLFFPTILLAFDLDGIKTLLQSMLDIINTVGIALVFGMALLFFFWGMGQFILNDTSNDKGRAEGKQKMLWGVIALFVMLSIYGIIKVIGDTLNIHQGSNGLTVPNIPGV